MTLEEKYKRIQSDLRDLTDYLQIQIVRKYMKDNGYYYETRYGSPYWEKD